MIPYNSREVVRGTMLSVTVSDANKPGEVTLKYYMVLKKLSSYEYRVFDLTDQKKKNIRVPTGWISHEEYLKSLHLTERWEMALPTHKVLTFK